MTFFENVYRIINKYNQKTRNAKCYGTTDLLYPAEVHMIEIIGTYEGITTTKLAEKLGITKGAVSQITRKLLDKEMIVKEPAGEKSNEVRIFLTEKGRVVFDYHRDKHQDMLNKIELIMADLSEENKAVMTKVIAVMEETLDGM